MHPLGIYVGLARTIYLRCVHGIFGRDITEYTVHIYGSGQPYIYELTSFLPLFSHLICSFLVYTSRVWMPFSLDQFWRLSNHYLMHNQKHRFFTLTSAFSMLVLRGIHIHARLTNWGVGTSSGKSITITSPIRSSLWSFSLVKFLMILLKGDGLGRGSRVSGLGTSGLVCLDLVVDGAMRR